MLAALTAGKNMTCKELLEAVHKDVDVFVGQADQFDDITMLCIERKTEASDMKKISLAPSLETLPTAFAFFEEQLSGASVSQKVMVQVNTAVDEIFSNIARYSGASMATLGCQITDSEIVLRFSDNGRPYDPTEKADPDTSLSAEDREIGGLGIFMVRKMMDEMHYEYADGLNILTLIKKV